MNNVYYSWGKQKKAELPRTTVTSARTTTVAEAIKFLTVKEIKALNADFKKVGEFLNSAKIKTVVTSFDTCYFLQPSAYCQVIAKRFSDQQIGISRSVQVVILNLRM